MSPPATGSSISKKMFCYNEGDIESTPSKRPPMILPNIPKKTRHILQRAGRIVPRKLFFSRADENLFVEDDSNLQCTPPNAKRHCVTTPNAPMKTQCFIQRRETASFVPRKLFYNNNIENGNEDVLFERILDEANKQLSIEAAIEASIILQSALSNDERPPMIKPNTSRAQRCNTATTNSNRLAYNLVN